jgi:hypothetical protein
MTWWRFFLSLHILYIAICYTYVLVHIARSDLIVFSIHKCSAHFCVISSDIFRLENLSVWQIPVFLYGLLRRNWGYIEFEMLEKQCCSYLRNIKTAINYVCKRFEHNLLIFLIGKIWMNIGICQTLGFSILKMPALDSTVFTLFFF